MHRVRTSKHRSSRTFELGYFESEISTEVDVAYTYKEGHHRLIGYQLHRVRHRVSHKTEKKRRKKISVSLWHHLHPEARIECERRLKQKKRDESGEWKWYTERQVSKRDAQKIISALV